MSLRSWYRRWKFYQQPGVKKGVCCEYCVKWEQVRCPIRSSLGWRTYRDWCSQYEPDPNIPEARKLR